ncbi:MAG: lysophospholipid acyltransferase family protein [Desulfuromonadales bacterium]|nr:lysophospholipid acyltransferase family protein [Desulfuromonadales bacterium]
MSETSTEIKPFLFARREKAKLPGPRQVGLRLLEFALGLKRCQMLYETLDKDCAVHEFTACALRTLGAEYRVDPAELARIPRNGPCVLIANHPYGGLDGLILFHLISSLRADFKVMGNYLLGRIPQLKQHIIHVDPFGGKASAVDNIAPLRKALRILQKGELLVIFPAGEVSSRQAEYGGVADPCWSTTLARIVRRGKAPVLPVFFPGSNGGLFHFAGQLHSKLRTVLLPRMLLNKRGLCVRPRIGHPLPSARLLGQGLDDRALTDYLRFRTYALGMAEAGSTADRHPAGVSAGQQPLIEPVTVTELAGEIAALPSSQTLVESGESTVYYAQAEQIPRLLREIGRLREFSFRQAGEGTGRDCDLDRFDKHYLHLFIWNRASEEIVGAYRIGQVDRLLAAGGLNQLYSATLFHFQPQLFERVGNSLELGRSFVRPEYQRSYAPLLLLWKGIARYLALNPDYRYLFGPVSISAEYRDCSRQLLAESLTRSHQLNELSRLVSARLPIRLKPLKIKGVNATQAESLLQDIESVSALVADLELDGKGIPVLLRHYLGLGGKLLAFNRDPDFSDVIDGLLLIDVPEAERRQLQRYMGQEAYLDYVAYHQRKLGCCA